MNLFRLNSKLIAAAYLAATALLIAGGCDDGKIYPDDADSEVTGMTVTMIGELSGCGKYTTGDYSVALAAFEEDNEFAIVSKNLSDGTGDVVITNVDRKVSTVEVCIINRLRERVITMASADVDDPSESDITLNVGKLDVSPFSAINNGIFTTTCLQCHGGTETPAAGLDLSPEKAYADIVGAPSNVAAGELIVSPGNADASTLWQAVATDVSEKWRFDHSNLLTADKAAFIQSWINTGADD